MVTTETDNTRRILDLLAQGKITVDEADQLLRAVGGPAGGPSSADRGAPGPQSSPGSPGSQGSQGSRGRSDARWMRVTIDKGARDGRPPKQVSIRVPMALVRGGVRLGAIFPYKGNDPISQHLRNHGVDVDWSKIDLSQLDSVLQNLDETTIDVDKGKAQVRISYE
jgi:ribosomal protein L15